MYSPTETVRYKAERATRRARYASYLSFALVTGAALLGLYFLQQAGFFSTLAPKPIQPVPEVRRSEQISSQISDVAGFDREQQPYKLSAKEGFQDKDQPNLVHLDQLVGTFRKKSGKTFDLAADTGLYDTKTREMDLAGNVKITQSGGMTATMSKAHVAVETKALTTDVPVEVITGDGKINAGGMKISDDGQTILFLNGVKARFGGDGKGDKP